MVDFAIPSGRFNLTAVLDDQIRASCAAPHRRDGFAHPVFAFVAALGGMGMRIGDVCRGLGLAFDDGAVLGRCQIAYDIPLEVDRFYDVDAEVISVERKSSRRFGAADHLALHMTVGASGKAHAHVSLTTIMPARS